MIQTDKVKCPHCGSQHIYYRWDATVWECLKCSAWFYIKLDLTHDNWQYFKPQYDMNKIWQHLTKTQFYHRMFKTEKTASLYHCKECGNVFPLELAIKDRCIYCLSTKFAPYRE